MVHVTATLVTLALPTVPLPPVTTQRLRRIRRLRHDRDAVRATAGDCRGKREAGRACADGEFVADTVDQHQAAAGQTRHRAADSVGNWDAAVVLRTAAATTDD